MAMMLCLGLLTLCAGIIYCACELFVNAIEWLGHKLRMGQTAVGTVLAAFGTALPECVVTAVATLEGADDAARDVAVGAAMGGPLVLATLAYGVVGLALLYKRGTRGLGGAVDADTEHLAADQRVFIGIYGAKVVLGGIAFAYKPACAALFVLMYGLYLWRELGRREQASLYTQLDPLRLTPRALVPPLWAVLTQVTVSVAVTAWAAQLFVTQLVTLGGLWHLPPHVVALVLSPVATELPEILNACIWVRQGKERLAFANISGSMMIQATLPSALGIAYTPWLFDGPLWAAAAITLVAMVYLCATLMRGRLMVRHLVACPPLYVLFACYLLLRGPG